MHHHTPLPASNGNTNPSVDTSEPAESQAPETDAYMDLYALPLAPSFSLGQVVATPGALEALEAAGVTPAQLLARHQRGDWGDLDAHDKNANYEALLTGARLLSAYILPVTQERIWIITEADRSVTTLLLPEEY